MIARLLAALMPPLLTCVAMPVLAQDSWRVPTSGDWRDITIASEDGVVLAGTLILPKGHGDGPFPLVISMSGDGPNPRGGYHLLSERLLAEGIATFEYDKRGSGESTGTFQPLLTEAAADGRAVFHFFLDFEEIDGHRVAVTGHSESAAAAPMFLRDEPALAAFVGIAGPAAPQESMFLDALAGNLTSSGHSADAIAPLLSATRQLMEAHERNAGEAEIAPLREAVISAFESLGFERDAAEATYAVLDNPQTRQMYQLAAQDNLRSIDAPVLLIYGSQDNIVSPELNADYGVAALRGNPDAAVVTIAGVNHWMIRADGPERPPDMGWPVSAPEFLDLVTAWLAKRLLDNNPG